MMSQLQARLTRRELLRTSMFAGGVRLIGFDKIAAAVASPLQDSRDSGPKDPFQGGKQLGLVVFVNELSFPLGTALGSELDGRLYTDLSGMTPQGSITPTEKFFIRTRASKLLDQQKPWSIKVGGLVRQPLDLPAARLRGMAKPA